MYVRTTFESPTSRARPLLSDTERRQRQAAGCFDLEMQAPSFGSASSSVASYEPNIDLDDVFSACFDDTQDSLITNDRAAPVAALPRYVRERVRRQHLALPVEKPDGALAGLSV